MNNYSGNIKILGEKDLAAACELEQKVFQSLPESEKSFIVPKDKEALSKLCNKQNGVIFGIYDQNNKALMASASLIMPTSKNPETSLEAYEVIDIENAGILMGVKVDKAFRGNGLMHKLTIKREQFAREKGRFNLYSEVASKNVVSWRNLLEDGFGIVAHATIIEYGKEVGLYYLHKNLLNEFSINQSDICYAEAATDNLQVQNNLIAEGYRGIGLTDKGHIRFAKVLGF